MSVCFPVWLSLAPSQCCMMRCLPAPGRCQTQGQEKIVRGQIWDEKAKMKAVHLITIHQWHQIYSREDNEKVKFLLVCISLITLIRVISTKENLSSPLGFSDITREVGMKSKISWIILTDVSEKSLSKIKLKGILVALTEADSSLCLHSMIKLLLISAHSLFKSLKSRWIMFIPIELMSLFINFVPNTAFY